jgi:hypothetical protein
MRTALKNRVHALIARHGIQRQHSDLFGAGGRRFVAELRLRPQPRRRLDALLGLIDDFDREIAALSVEIDARASDDPFVVSEARVDGPVHRACTESATAAPVDCAAVRWVATAVAVPAVLGLLWSPRHLAATPPN